jgi:23S rRNA (uracil1939-C5)-methyltransferase
MTLPRESEQTEVQSQGGSPRSIVRADIPVYGGYVICRDAKIVFIRGAIPGELVEVSIDERKRDYSLATVRHIIEPSPYRRQPPCPVFGTCGGCQLQFMEYEKQVAVKEEILLDALKRIGDMDITLMPSMAGKEFRYRHRAQLKVSPRGAIGFYREGTREVVDIEECPLMRDEINDFLRKVRTMDLKGVKELHVSSGDTMTLLIKGTVIDDTVQGLWETGISGIGFENGDSVGKDYVTLDLNGLRYSVTPWSFFQSHWSLNREVVAEVIRELTPMGQTRILDLYAGAGNFSLPLSLIAQEVVAVEENSSAVEDGRRNLMLNGIKNCTFVHGRMGKNLVTKKKDAVTKLFEDPPYGCVILDPPRTGLSPDCVRKVMDAGSERIVYVSCNPATLARDVKKMREHYDVESVRMVDFFPNTYHIETLMFLRRKASHA